MTTAEHRGEYFDLGASLEPGQTHPGRSQSGGQAKSTSHMSAEQPSSTIRVHNVGNGSTYHLLFDGDVDGLSGEQLMAHVHTITGIPQADQDLTLSGHRIQTWEVGDAAGFFNGCTVDLRDKRDDRGVMTRGSRSVSREPEPVGDHHLRRAVRDDSYTDSDVDEVQVEVSVEPLIQPSTARDTSVNQPANVARTSASILHNSPLGVPLFTEQQLTERERAAANPNHYGMNYQSQVLNTSTGVNVTPAGAAAASMGPRGGVAGENTTTLQSRVTKLLNDSEIIRAGEGVNHAAGDYQWQLDQLRFEAERTMSAGELRRRKERMLYDSSCMDRELETLNRVRTAQQRKIDDLHSYLKEEEDIVMRLRYAL